MATSPSEHNSDTLRPILRKAILAYHSILKNQEISILKREIYRVCDNGFSTQEIAFPRYRVYRENALREALNQEDVRYYLDYIWEHIVSKRIDLKSDSSWNLIALRERIDDPISRVLEEAAIDEASDTGKVTLWRLPDESIDLLVEEEFSRTLSGKHKYVAYCPLGYVSGEKGSSWSLSDNMKLRILTHEERARYLSRHHDKFLWHDFVSRDHVGICAILEIYGEIRFKEYQNQVSDVVEEEIADMIDIVKWALMLCANNSMPLVEGTNIYQNVLGGSFCTTGTGSFRRQDKTIGSDYKLNNIDMNRVKELIKNAQKVISISNDVKNAFWFWSRSTVAALNRDALVEAVVGLESLLIGKGTELNHRFKLYGTAILAASESEVEEVAKKLGDLYAARSSSVHGEKKEKQIQEVTEARYYLSKAILKVIDLCERKLIDPSSSIGHQLEKFVLRKSLIL